MDKKIIFTVLLISIAMSGCSSSNIKKNSNGATDKPRKTVADIMKSQGGSIDVDAYRKATAKAANRSLLANVTPRSREIPLAHYTRTEAKELKGIFPRLPNPDLCMYVYPHLSLEDATIPGYTSCFSMYDKNHYALPGEMSTFMQSTY